MDKINETIPDKLEMPIKFVATLSGVLIDCESLDWPNPIEMSCRVRSLREISRSTDKTLVIRPPNTIRLLISFNEISIESDQRRRTEMSI